jgi:hypothetical protein
MSAVEIEYITANSLTLEEQAPLAISWARIVWVDPSSPPTCRSLLGTWLGLRCEDGQVAWRHSQVYVIRAGQDGACKVKVGDIRECAASRHPPKRHA